jgi:hypothetical protein
MTDSRHNHAHDEGRKTVSGWGILRQSLAALRNVEAFIPPLDLSVTMVTVLIATPGTVAGCD